MDLLHELLNLGSAQIVVDGQRDEVNARAREAMHDRVLGQRARFRCPIAEVPFVDDVQAARRVRGEGDGCIHFARGLRDDGVDGERSHLLDRPAETRKARRRAVIDGDANVPDACRRRNSRDGAARRIDREPWGQTERAERQRIAVAIGGCNRQFDRDADDPGLIAGIDDDRHGVRADRRDHRRATLEAKAVQPSARTAVERIARVAGTASERALGRATCAANGSEELAGPRESAGRRQ